MVVLKVVLANVPWDSSQQRCSDTPMVTVCRHAVVVSCCSLVLGWLVRQTCGWVSCVRRNVVVADDGVVVVVVKVVVAMTPLCCHRECRDSPSTLPSHRFQLVDRLVLDWLVVFDFVLDRKCCLTVVVDELVHFQLVLFLDM